MPGTIKNAGQKRTETDLSDFAPGRWKYLFYPEPV